jgi:hypothetical protein
VPLNSDPEATYRGIISWVIRALYEAFLPEIIINSREFIYNRAGPYYSLIIRDILREMGIRVMKWLLYSLDLNPIENLYTLIKAELYRLYPELEYVPDTEETLDILIREV